MALAVDAGGRVSAPPRRKSPANGTSAVSGIAEGTGQLLSNINNNVNGLVSSIVGGSKPSITTSGNQLSSSSRPSSTTSNNISVSAPAALSTGTETSTPASPVSLVDTIKANIPEDAKKSPLEASELSPAVGNERLTTTAPSGLSSSAGVPSIGADELFHDVQSDYIGNNETNEAYLQDAISQGMSEEDAQTIRDRDKTWWEAIASKWGKQLSPFETDINLNADSTGDFTVMDDGSVFDYDHMTADKMTGTQYLHYADMGMGGRPVEQIDPTQVYSKRRELMNYGFVPFTPDETAYANMVTSNVMDLPNRLGTMVSGLRENVTPDYTIKYGNGTTISGRDFDRLAQPLLNQFYYNEQFSPETFLKPSKDSSAIVHEYTVPDKSGNDTYHYGELSAVQDNGDETYTVSFTDGTTVDISQEYLDSISDGSGNVTMGYDRVTADRAKGNLPKNLDSLNTRDFDELKSMSDEFGGSPLDYANVYYLPNLTMSDGTKVSLPDVERIYFDETPGNDAGNNDDDIGYGFSDVSLLGKKLFDNKPRRFVQQEMFKTNEQGGLEHDLSDIGDNAVDWTLGSLPISIGETMPWVYSTSGATSSMSGVNPATYSPGLDSYGLIAGSYDKDGNLIYGVSDANGKRDDALSDSTRWWNTAGTAAVPLTEMIVGPVGEHIVPLEQMSDSLFGKIARDEFGNLINPTSGQVVRNALVGAVGEGIEEDFGNLFDEMTQYGPGGMFANATTDSEGKPITDMYGHEVRNYDTYLGDRMNNAFDPGDLANSFAGGVSVDALMQFLPTGIQLAPAVKRDLARRKTGVSQFVEPEYGEWRNLNAEDIHNMVEER